MESSVKMAWAIVLMFIGLTLFFFAFHPGGVAGPNGANVSNPTEMLQFLIAEFQKGAGITTATDATLTSADATGANYAGYTSASDTGAGSSTSSNTTLE